MQSHFRLPVGTHQRAYSARKASTGFTEAARCAGRKLATTEANPSETATHVRVIASHACTPKSSLRIDIDAPIEQISPIASPTAVSHPASRITSLYTELRCAPSA